MEKGISARATIIPTPSSLVIAPGRALRDATPRVSLLSREGLSMRRAATSRRPRTARCVAAAAAEATATAMVAVAATAERDAVRTLAESRVVPRREEKERKSRGGKIRPDS